MRARVRAFRSVVVLSALALAFPGVARAQGQFIDIGGARIHYLVEGEGPALVLIHGYTLDLRMWDDQAQSLKKSFKVIRFDRRGSGRSTGAEDVSGDPADLAALLDTLGVRRAVVLGMSRGGLSALRFALTYPERTERLILHGTPPPAGFAIPWNGPDQIPFDSYRSLAREGRMDEVRRLWGSHPLLVVPKNKPGVQGRLLEMLKTYSGDDLRSPVTPSGASVAPTMENVSGLRLPTLIVIGEDEIPYFQIVARTFAYIIPGAKLAVIPGGGHLINMIQPTAYNAVIRRFVAQSVGR